MKKSSTAAAASKKNFESEADDRFGSGRSVELVLRAGRSWRSRGREEAGHDSESDEGSLRGDATQPRSPGDRNALAVGKSAVERIGPRSDRGARPQRASDRREPAERRSAGCQDAGAAGTDRPAVAVSGETSQCPGAGRPDGDSSASQPGAGTDGAGEHSAWA